MAVGKPLLATWDVDGTIRTYEYSSGAFVQIGTSGGHVHTPPAAALAAGADPAPLLAWDYDDNYLLILRTRSQSSTIAHTFTPTLQAVSPFTVVNQDAGSNQGGKYTSSPSRHEYSYIASTYTARVNVRMGPTGLLTVVSNGNSNNLNGQTAVSDADVDFTGGYQFLTYTVGTNNGILYFRQVDADGTNWYTYGGFNFSAKVEKMAYSNNGQSAILSFNNGTAKVYTYSMQPAPPTMTYLHDIQRPAGTTVNIVMSPDNKYAAISVLNGGVYTTAIYKRISTYFMFVQTVTNFGKLLSFSADGELLVDCGLRKALLRGADTYAVHDTAMAAIPNLIQAQAMSKGLVYPFGMASLYENAVEFFAKGQVNLNDLRLQLLTADATFSDAHLTMNQVTNNGAYRVTTGKWPAAGVALTGVTTQEGFGTLSVKANDVSFIVLETNMSARYAVIFEAGTSRPLIWIDLLNLRTFARGRELLVKFKDNEFLRFSR